MWDKLRLAHMQMLILVFHDVNFMNKCKKKYELMQFKNLNRIDNLHGWTSVV